MSKLDAYSEMMATVAAGGRVVMDGGTGTEIEKRGVPPITDAWSSTGALDGPDVVCGVHEAYLRAGARIVITNTFSTSRHALVDAGLEDRFEDLNRQGVELAKQACVNVGLPAVVAGGVTHWSWTRRHPSLNDLRTGVEHQAKIMADAGVDMFILEMASDIDRMLTLLDATSQTGLPVWVGFSCEIAEPSEGDPEDVRLLHGPTLQEGIEALEGRGVDVVSIMHTEVRDIDRCLDVVDSAWNGPVGVYAHSGRFINPNWIFDDVISAEEYAAAAERWLDRGVQIMGGCCGIGPSHIESITDLMAD